MKRLLLAATTFAVGCAATPERESVDPPPRAPAKVEQLVVGSDHACALLQNGEVWCFGRNDSGQSGPSDSVWPLTAQRVTGLGPASAIAAHRDSTCAIVDGEVFCFGDNRSGHLGVPSDGTCDFECVTTPRKVPAIRDARGLAMGGHGTCIVRDDGSVYCVRPQPEYGFVVAQRQAGIERATAVSVGNTHACALRDDGRVVCWGRNHYGSLGVADRTATEPVVVPNVERVVALQVAADATCALDDQGTLRCWGVLAGTPIETGTGTEIYPRIEVSHDPVAAKGGPFTSFAIGGGHRRVYCLYDCYPGAVSSCTVDQHGEMACRGTETYRWFDAWRPRPETTDTMNVGPASMCFAVDDTIHCRGNSGLLGARPEPIGF